MVPSAGRMTGQNVTVSHTDSACTIGDARTGTSGVDAATVWVRRSAAAATSATRMIGSDATEKHMPITRTIRDVRSMIWLEDDVTVGDVWTHVIKNITS